MHTWKKIYRWKTHITRFLKIEAQASICKKNTYRSKMDEEQSWLGIG